VASHSHSGLFVFGSPQFRIRQGLLRRSIFGRAPKQRQLEGSAAVRTDQNCLNNQATALDRTLRLMRDEISSAATDRDLLDALTGSEIALVADAANLKSHACQTAFVAAALLMARSGHTVYLVAPDVRLTGEQPPLSKDSLVSALIDVGRDLVPGIEFRTGPPTHAIDAAVLFGGSEWKGGADVVFHVGSTAWRGWISTAHEVDQWPSDGWPIGALAAADLVASEAFKIAMRKLRRFATHPGIFDELFAESPRAVFVLAPDGTPTRCELGAFDIISGGAIAQAALFTFARVQGATARVRVIEPDINEISNLNRNMLLRRSRLEVSKARDIAEQRLGSISVIPIETRYGDSSEEELGGLMPIVLVGVDHIPTRWMVQRMHPAWLAVGATSHFLAMCSFHTPSLPCAGCLHPHDDASDDPIPTVAFVSYAAGLMVASRYLYHLGTGQLPSEEQQLLFRPLRPERPWRSRVAPRTDCPVNCLFSKPIDVLGKNPQSPVS
jgi:hypothetical protein